MAQKKKKNKLLRKQFSFKQKTGSSKPIYQVFKKSSSKRGINKSKLPATNLQRKTLSYLNKTASRLGIPAQNLDQFRRTALGKNKITTSKSLKVLKQKTSRLNKSSKFKDLAKSFSLTPKEAGVEGMEDNTIDNLRGKLFENQEQFYQENKEWLKRINELNSKASLHWKQERELENLQEAMRREYAKKVEKDEEDFNKRLIKSLFG